MRKCEMKNQLEETSKQPQHTLEHSKIYRYMKQFHCVSVSEIYYLRQLTADGGNNWITCEWNMCINVSQFCANSFSVSSLSFLIFVFSFFFLLYVHTLSTPPVALFHSHRFVSCIRPCAPTLLLNYSFYNNIHSIHFHLRAWHGSRRELECVLDACCCRSIWYRSAD